MSAVQPITVGDVASDVVELAKAETKQAVRFARTKPLVLLGIGLAGAAVGAVVAYKVAERKLSARFEEILDHEMREARAKYAIMAKERNSPEELVEVLIPEATAQDAMKAYQGRPPVSYDKVTPIRQVQLPEPEAEILGLDEEMIAARDHRAPYIISSAEFMADDQNFGQETLTFYRLDGQLADTNDELIVDVDGLVGNDNMLKFGVGSGDPNVVYVRNELREMEYEITLSRGSYEQEVKGLVPEGVIRHSSDRRRQPRFRKDRDE